MIFHEKLKLKFDVDAMCDEIDSVQKRLGGPILQGSNQEFGGWSLQSDNGDWQRGFEEGAIYEHPLEGGYLGEVAKPTHEYNKRTEACTGIFSDILDELEDKGFYPHRTRITILEPMGMLTWSMSLPYIKHAMMEHPLACTSYHKCGSPKDTPNILW